MKKAIGVVGAGIAGLTAAHYLKRLGHNVTVFEASARVGGRISTDVVDGYVFDQGCQFLTSTYTTVLSLIEEVGLTSELQAVTPWNAILRSKRLRSVSNDHPWSTLTSGCLTLMEMLRSIPGLLRIRKATRGLALDDYAAWASLDDEESVKFLRRHLDQAFLDYLVEPYLNAVFNQSSRDVSKALAFMLLGLSFEKIKGLSLRPGLGELTRRIAANLDVRLRYPVTCVSKSNEGVLLQSPMGDVSVDSVIIATTATVARTIYPGATTLESELLQTPYSSTMVVSVLADPQWRLPAALSKIYVIFLPAGENSDIGAIAISTQKKQNGGAAERFYISPSLHAESRMSQLSDDEVGKEMLSGMDRYVPGIAKSARHVSVVRWKDALPKSPPGRSRNLRRYREALDPSARVILAGDYMGFPHAESAAFTGKWAAESLDRNAGK